MAINVRKTVAELVRRLVSETTAVETPEGTVAVSISPDATNPYATVVTANGKRYRVIVKEID